MKLTKKSIDYINKLNEEELRKLIFELTENEDVSDYLNNKISNKKIDNEKYIDKIEKLLYSVRPNVNEAIEIYYSLKRKYKDINSLVEVGLALFSGLINYADAGNYNTSLSRRITKVVDLLCNDISQIEDNTKYREDFEEIWDAASESYFDDIAEIYFMYFDGKLDEEDY